MNTKNTSGVNDRDPETQMAQVERMAAKDDINKEQSFTQLGITADFIWYESEILARDMSAWESRFKRLVSTMESRHKEHLQMIDGLLHEVKVLKQQLKEKQ